MKKLLLIFILFIICFYSYSQNKKDSVIIINGVKISTNTSKQKDTRAPEQDCINAIPVCLESYEQPNSYEGVGSILDEININISCLGSGERNDVWYIFTTQSDGYVHFLITPNNMSNDYDWAVFNLTNASCSDIKDIASLEVSCNYSGTPGTTGANGESSFHSQGAAGTPYNALIPVYANETYVLNVSNFSTSNQSGYVLNFSESTAGIYDVIDPLLSEVNFDNTSCDAPTSMGIAFSEKVLCYSVSPADLIITGPDGEHQVTSVNGEDCVGETGSSKYFDIEFDPPITDNGSYVLSLTGEIRDLCNNISTGSEIEFEVDLHFVAPFQMTGGGVFCSNTEAPEIGVSNSQEGVNYQLFRNDVFVTEKNGTGTAISFGSFTEEGIYTAKGITEHCTEDMQGSASIEMTLQPQVYGLFGGGQICEGSDTAEIFLESSELEISYELYRNGVLISEIIGTGSTLNFGLFMEDGIYTAKAINENCISDMNGEVEISYYYTPEVYTLTGGGYFCEGENGAEITLSNSEDGINYQLYLNGNPIGQEIPGNGAALSFGFQNQAGTYSAKATLQGFSCVSDMAGQVDVSMINNPIVELEPVNSTLIGQDTIIVCLFDTVLIDAGNEGCTYLWNNGFDGQSFEIYTLGVGYDSRYYQVNVTNSFGCTSSDEITIIFDYNSCLGYDEDGNEYSIVVFPNPATSNKINVLCSGINKDMQVQLLNMNGQVLNEKMITYSGEDKMRLSMNLSSCKSGVYVLQFTFGETLYKEKVIVIK